MPDLPPPPVPADLDLQDFTFMPLDVQRLRSSDLAASETPEACWAAVLLWAASWHQVPASSLPDEDRVLANLAGYGREVKRWAKVRAGALRGFMKASDGRLYHPVVAEKAIEAWLEKLAQRISAGEGNAKRWGLVFDRAPFAAAMEESRRLLAVLNPQSRTLSRKRTAALVPESREQDTGTPPGSRRDRKYKGQGQGQGQGGGGGKAPPPPPPGDDPIGTDQPKPSVPLAEGVAVQRRSLNLGDLQAMNPVLLVPREDRDAMETTLALYGWDPCTDGLQRLTVVAKTRPAGQNRVFPSELRAWLGANYKLGPEDYARAGVPDPTEGI